MRAMGWQMTCPCRCYRVTAAAGTMGSCTLRTKTISGLVIEGNNHRFQGCVLTDLTSMLLFSTHNLPAVAPKIRLVKGI